MLVEACKHNPEDASGAKKLCDQCKKAIKGNIKVQPFKKRTSASPCRRGRAESTGMGTRTREISDSVTTSSLGFHLLGRKPVL